jgi:hypothetical protein
MSVHTHFVSRFLVNAVSCANRDAAAAAADSSLRGENIVNSFSNVYFCVVVVVWLRR